MTSKSLSTSNTHSTIFLLSSFSWVFQDLFLQYLIWDSNRILKKYFPLNKPVRCTSLKTGVYTDANDSQSEQDKTKDEEDFHVWKKQLMTIYSDDMTDSNRLALLVLWIGFLELDLTIIILRSLLDVAVGNIHSRKGRFLCSVPMLYKSLQDIDYKAYEAFLSKQLKLKDGGNVYIDPWVATGKRSEEYIIGSINNYELVTTTMAFYKTPVSNIFLLRLREIFQHNPILKKVYTATCKKETCRKVDGICLVIKSVESKEDQSGAEVLKIIENIMDVELRRKLTEQLEEEMYNEMMNFKIIVQVGV